MRQHLHHCCIRHHPFFGIKRVHLFSLIICFIIIEGKVLNQAQVGIRLSNLKKHLSPSQLQDQFKAKEGV